MIEVDDPEVTTPHQSSIREKVDELVALCHVVTPPPLIDETECVVSPRTEGEASRMLPVAVAPGSVITVGVPQHAAFFCTNVIVPNAAFDRNNARKISFFIAPLFCLPSVRNSRDGNYSLVGVDRRRSRATHCCLDDDAATGDTVIATCYCRELTRLGPRATGVCHCL